MKPEEYRTQQARIKELEEALDTIAGGWMDRFPGAPPLTADTVPVIWRSEMWVWSQKVARAALKGEGRK